MNDTVADIDGNIALIMAMGSATADEAARALNENGGNVDRAMAQLYDDNKGRSLRHTTTERPIKMSRDNDNMKCDMDAKKGRSKRASRGQEEDDESIAQPGCATSGSADLKMPDPADIDGNIALIMAMGSATADEAARALNENDGNVDRAMAQLYNGTTDEARQVENREARSVSARRSQYKDDMDKPPGEEVAYVYSPHVHGRTAGRSGRNGE